MANYRFKAMPVYIGSQKVAELQDADAEINSNDEAQEGVDSYLGHSEGITMSSLQCGTIVPYGGSTVRGIDLIKSKQNVNVGFFVDGLMMQASMRCTKWGAKSTSKNGVVKGSFSFEGGEPSAT